MAGPDVSGDAAGNPGPVDLTSREITFTVVAGDLAELSVRDEHFTVTAGRPLRVPLAHQGRASRVHCHLRRSTVGQMGH